MPCSVCTMTYLLSLRYRCFPPGFNRSQADEQQYEVIFSDSYISDKEASVIFEQASSSIHTPPQASGTSNTKSIDTHSKSQAPLHSSDNSQNVFDPSTETYELLWLHGLEHLCTIPIVKPTLKNETSEAEARLAEQKELARASDRGWELLKELEGNCL